jgi:hypothetical protein
MDPSGVVFFDRISPDIYRTSPLSQRSNEAIATGSLGRSNTSGLCVAKCHAMVGRDILFRIRLDKF